jgi:hypothetical protein
MQSLSLHRQGQSRDGGAESQHGTEAYRDDRRDSPRMQYMSLPYSDSIIESIASLPTQPAGKMRRAVSSERR